MHFDEGSARVEVERIREACAELGIDEEMTALILGSHRRDQALTAPTVDEVEDICGYVRRKLAIWEGIFDGPLR